MNNKSINWACCSMTKEALLEKSALVCLNQFVKYTKILGVTNIKKN